MRIKLKHSIILALAALGVALLPMSESKAQCRYLCTNSAFQDYVVSAADGFTVCLNGRSLQET